jgi:TonB family protein
VKASSRFAVAVVVTLLTGGALAAAVDHAWFPVRPRALCVLPLGTGGHLAHFGYVSEAEAAIALPVGDRNALLDGASSEGLPERFEPGAVGTLEAPAFVAQFSGATMRWRLGPREEEVDPEALPRCPLKNLPPVAPDLAMVLPPPPPPPKVEPPPPPDEPPPAPETPAPPPKAVPDRPRPKQADPKPAEPAKPAEPIALQLSGLTNLGTAGIAINAGDTDSLGSAEVPPTEANTRPPEPPRDGAAEGPETAPRKVVRREARVLSAPSDGAGWPEDAPPRSGPVRVKLSLRVGTDGKVREVRVVKQAGEAFDRAARSIGLKVVFSPATEDGVPVEVWVPWTVEFAPVDW